MIKKKELRKDQIKLKIDRILDSIGFIEENLPENVKNFEGSRILRNSIYKEIEFAIENIIDISNIINSDLRLGTPETEDSIIEHLSNNKIFEKKVIDTISEMKRFRNILIHRYGEVNDKLAFENIKEGLKDFELIVKKIEKFLKKT